MPELRLFSRIMAAAALSLALPAVGFAQDPETPQPKPLVLDAQIDAAVPRIRLMLRDVKPAPDGTVEIGRRPLGASGPDSWTVIATVPGQELSYDDTEIEPGTAYEYRVRRATGETVQSGYYAAGIDLPAIETRGTAVLVVDTAIADRLAPEIDRFADDLAGDGWNLRRITAPRGTERAPWPNLEAAQQLKLSLAQLRARHARGEFAIILLGHVPVVESGNFAPDGHDPAPIASDLFYADLRSQWPVSREGALLADMLPGGRIDAQIGRIDFAGFPARSEIANLRAYLDRNHAWRHGAWGDLREAYGSNVHVEIERSALVNIVGRDAVTEGDHHGVGEERRWLFGIARDSVKSPEGLSDPGAKPVFAMNFGSYKMNFARPKNPMIGLMVPPDQALAVGWGGRPAWRLHAMALGRTIGDAHFRTVNNGRSSTYALADVDYLPTGRYLFMNSIWINLVGDPTLHAFPAMPPSGLTVRQTATGAELGWTAPAEDVLGYRLYRVGADGDFHPVTPDLIEGTSFTDPEGRPGLRYMLRALSRKEVHAGSFNMLSQGIFATCCEG